VAAPSRARARTAAPCDVRPAAPRCARFALAGALSALLAGAALAADPPQPRGLPPAPEFKDPRLAAPVPAVANPAFEKMGAARAHAAGWRGQGQLVAFWNPATAESSVSCDDPDVRPALYVNAAEDRNGNGRLDPADLDGVDDDDNGCADDVHGCRFRPDGADGKVCNLVGSTHDAHVLAYAVGRPGGQRLGFAPEAHALLVAGALHTPDVLERVWAYVERMRARSLVSAIAGGPQLKTAAGCTAVGTGTHPRWLELAARPGAPLWLLGFPDRWPMCDPEQLALVGVMKDDASVVGNAASSVPSPFVDLAVTADAGRDKGQSWALGMAGGIVALLAQRFPEATRAELLARLCRTAAKIGPEPYAGVHPQVPDASWNPRYGCGRIDLVRALELEP
jgi:hypothetical protein